MLLQTRPQGRTVRSHNPNRRPVAAHTVRAPYSEAACWIVSLYVGHSSQQLTSTFQLHGKVATVGVNTLTTVASSHQPQVVGSGRTGSCSRRRQSAAASEP